VTTEDTHDQEALQAQLDQSRARLDGLLRDLHTVDAELEGLSFEREQYQLLQQVCGGLEKLSGLGGAGLFWDGEPGVGNGDYHLRIVRDRIDEFELRLGEIEKTRQGLMDQVRLAQDDADLIEDDVFEAKRQEEIKKLEWVVERDIDPLPDRETIMPWSRGGEDDDRFRKSLASSLLAALLLGLLFPLIDLPIPERWKTIEVPERLASLIREEQPPPPPPKQEITAPEETVPEASEEKTPQIVEEKTPTTSPEPAPKANVETKGILAFRDQFSGLKEKDPTSRLGAQAQIDRSGELAAGRPQRAMVATQAPGSSGGINIAALSRNTVGGGGGELEGVETQRATSAIGSIGASDRPLSGGPGLGRTDEEIQIVFDRHKSALYRLYNRELRRDPTLKGQMVLRFTIETDGSVSLCELKSTDMNAPKLSSQVVGRVKTFDFGAKEGVPAITILYPIDFLPAT
jgi:outer membrane biosynthesis protein TonB